MRRKSRRRGEGNRRRSRSRGENAENRLTVVNPVPGSGPIVASFAVIP